MNFNKYQQPIGDPVANWSPSQLPDKNISLAGSFCTLEPVNQQKHADDLYHAHFSIQDDSRWTYLPMEKPSTKEEFFSYVKNLATSQDPFHYAVIDKTNNKAIGAVALMRIDRQNGVVEIGHVNWSPLLQNKTAATEGIYLLLKHLFSTLGYRRCEWKCDNLNQPSKKAALRFGFQYEGLFRQAIVTKGRNRDTAWFSIIDKDWATIDKAFKNWLQSDNFDENGKQKNRLTIK